MLRLLALATLCASGAAQETDPRARLPHWLESLELDLPMEVVREARPLVEGGALSKEGEALALYSRALSATGGAAHAWELLSKSDARAETRAAVEVELARLELEDDKLREVEARLATAPDAAVPVRYPERAESWLVLGRARVRAGRATDGAPLLRVFVERWRLHPDAAGAWHMLAQEALARRDTETAHTCRERARELGTWHGYYRARRLQIREQPTAPLPRLGLAQLWIAVNELQRARAVLVELVERAPEFCRGWATLGEVERKRGQAVAARDAYDRALECDPALDSVRFNRALLARMEGRALDARADLERLLAGEGAEDARFLEAHLALAQLLNAAGEEAAAQARYAAYRRRGGTQPL